MDADDISTPERFDKQLKWLNKTNTDVCGSWVQLFGTTDKRVLKHATTDEAIKFELMFGSCFAHPTVMIRTSLLKAFKYDSAWEKCEDYDLLERLARSGIKMTNVPEVLLKYRQHASQISTASWQKQFELSQNIRLRYSKHLFHKLNISEDWAIEVVKLRGNSDVMPNMDIIDLAFESLLEQSVGEQKEVIFDHATRLYFRVAGDCSDIVRRWSKLNFLYGNNFAVITKFKLFFLSTFKVKNNSIFFNFIKKLQFLISKST